MFTLIANLPLQQYLPLAVLKLRPFKNILLLTISTKLQQYLPLAVLKQLRHTYPGGMLFANVATVLTACGIET